MVRCCATWLQIVQSQELEAAELAEQVQELEGDRQHLQIVTQDLDLAEDRVRPRICCPSNTLASMHNVTHMSCMAVHCEHM